MSKVPPNSIPKDIAQMEENPVISIVITCVLIAFVSGCLGYYLGIQQTAKLASQQQVINQISPSVTPIASPLEDTFAYTLPLGWNKRAIMSSFTQKSGETMPLPELIITSPEKVISDQGVPTGASGVQIMIVKFKNPNSVASPLQQLTDKIKKSGIKEITQTSVDSQPTLHYFTDPNQAGEYYLVVQGNQPSYTWNIVVNYTGRDLADIQAQKKKYMSQVDQLLQSIHFK